MHAGHHLPHSRPPEKSRLQQCSKGDARLPMGSGNGLRQWAQAMVSGNGLIDRPLGSGNAGNSNYKGQRYDT